ncbi:hypothetical protein [Kordiimonas aquimaris]|uniref:hypothetical protein n=1 Tax=Kordiimonas aquimaris TaxID=707591 RepID=UPI0021D1AA76|nr:hypothetical protein [Kordiimonas aquimaris]
MSQQRECENKPRTETPRWILRAMRSWVRAILASSCSKTRSWHAQVWQESCAAFGSGDAVSIWGTFMAHLCTESSVTFQQGCAGCGRVSDDENALLQCIAAHQTGSKQKANMILQKWFKGEALWQADALVEAFADHLSQRGLIIPSSQEALPAFELTGSTQTHFHSVN